MAGQGPRGALQELAGAQRLVGPGQGAGAAAEDAPAGKCAHAQLGRTTCTTMYSIQHQAQERV